MSITTNYTETYLTNSHQLPLTNTQDDTSNINERIASSFDQVHLNQPAQTTRENPITAITNKEKTPITFLEWLNGMLSNDLDIQPNDLVYAGLLALFILVCAIAIIVIL